MLGNKSMKQNIYKTVLFSMAIVASLTSCRKESEVSGIVNPNNRICKTFSQQFDAVWNGMSQGYMFWGRDTVDWDQRYEQFKPVFEAFDARPASNPVTPSEYNAAYQGLFQGLLDHHLYGKFTVPKGQYEAIVSPGMNDYYLPDSYADMEASFSSACSDSTAQRDWARRRAAWSFSASFLAVSFIPDSAIFF